MFERFIGSGNEIYILWGMGLLGLLLKIMVSTYLKGMVKASENMATTKKRSLRIMRQKFENGKNLGINNGNEDAFTEKNVRSLRFLALPMELWRRSGQALCCAAFMMMSGAFLYKDVTWRGSPEMISFLANGFMVCAFLLALENIFLVNNKVEILKANIRGYFLNLSSPRDLSTRAPVRGVDHKNTDEVYCEEKTLDVVGDDAELGELESAAADAGDVGNEEVLNRFLKEFFS